MTDPHLIDLEPRTARTTAAYVARFLTQRKARKGQHDKDHAAHLLEHLLREGRYIGPATVARASYWIQKLAPLYCDWKVPSTARRITRRAQKEATTKNLTGGARPVGGSTMAQAIKRRLETKNPARWHADDLLYNGLTRQRDLLSWDLS